ncbi:tRNA pseudouridine(55) synthase TruB [Thermoproteota archaeon]
MVVEGFLLINKPEGLSSFQVVQKVRYLSGQKRVGHAGTLDPFSSGLLILALGRNFTRQIDRFQAMPKVYAVRMTEGIETDTLDSDGKITGVQPVTVVDQDLIERALSGFVGKQTQIAPIFSAKKINGKRSYALARAGETVEPKQSDIEIYSIEFLKVINVSYPIIDFTVCCSKGTYVRSLVRDIGEQLGFKAYTKDLIRVKIGPYSIDQAINYSQLSLDLIKKSLFQN